MYQIIHYKLLFHQYDLSSSTSREKTVLCLNSCFYFLYRSNSEKDIWIAIYQTESTKIDAQLLSIQYTLAKKCPIVSISTAK